MQGYTITIHPCIRAHVTCNVYWVVQYMYKIIYQQNLEKDDFHNLKKIMFKKLLSFYAIEIKLAHATEQ